MSYDSSSYVEPQLEFRASSPRDIVIPVIGPTGSGKSTFINFILGRNQMDVGHEQESCTTEISTAEVSPEKLPVRKCLRNRRVLLVDTPGFDSTDVGDWDVLEKIAKYLEDSYRNRVLIGGIIYLQDISLDRVSWSTKMCLDMVTKGCGIDNLRNVVLGATKCNRLPPEQISSRFHQLKNDHWSAVINMGAQAFPVAHDASSVVPIQMFCQAQTLLDAVLNRFEKEVVLDLQDELVNKNTPLKKTSVGKRILDRINRWKILLKRIFPVDF